MNLEREELSYEDENRGICETFRGISADSEEIGGEGVTPSYQTPIRSQILHREESSRGGESGDSDSGRYGYVYITENLINGKRYIGQHKSESFDESYKGSGKILKKAFDKYGWDNFKTEILEWCKGDKDLNEREIYWIDFYDAVNSPMFYNVVSGGYGTGRGENSYNYGKKHSEDRIEKNRQAHLGIKRSLESREKQSRSVRGENNPNYGRAMKDNVREALRVANAGRESPMKGKPANNRRSVVCIETGEVFECIKHAEDFIGKSIGASLYALMERKYTITSGGYHWGYIEDFNDLMSSEDGEMIIKGIRDGTLTKVDRSGSNNPNYGKSSTLRRKIKCLETGRVFDSVLEAALFLGKDSYMSNIIACAKNNLIGDPIHRSHGYHWVYVDKVASSDEGEGGEGEW